MCLCICTHVYVHVLCVCVCVCARVCVCVHVEVGEQSQVTFFRNFASPVCNSVAHRPETSPSRLEWLTASIERFPRLLFPPRHTRITSVSHNIRLFTWVLGIRTQILKPAASTFPTESSPHFVLNSATSLRAVGFLRQKEANLRGKY